MRVFPVVLACMVTMLFVACNGGGTPNATGVTLPGLLVTGLPTPLVSGAPSSTP